jgi:hypothetical protein
MRDIGAMTASTVREESIGMTVALMKGSIRRENTTGLGSSTGTVVKYVGSGLSRTAKPTAKDNSY